LRSAAVDGAIASVLVPTNPISAVCVPAVSTGTSTVGPATKTVFSIPFANTVAANGTGRRAVWVVGIGQVVAIVVLAVGAADLRVLCGDAKAGRIRVADTSARARIAAVDRTGIAVVTDDRREAADAGARVAAVRRAEVSVVTVAIGGTAAPTAIRTTNAYRALPLSSAVPAHAHEEGFTCYSFCRNLRLASAAVVVAGHRPLLCRTVVV
jgi:hypothetical protein